MTDNRTGLGAADIAEQFRDVCGDGSMEWVTGPMQAWLLLDAADMLDENDKLRGLCEWLLQVLQEYVAENERLRELCADLYAEMITYSNAPNYNASVWAPKLRELGVTDHD